MEAKKAAEILQRLADGLDVESGEPLSRDSQYNRPDAIRALFTAIRILEDPTRSDGAPPKAGGKWNDEEEERLVKAFDAGKTIKELAACHQRTAGAIRSRLIKLGRIEPPATSGEAAPVVAVNPKPDDDIPF